MEWRQEHWLQSQVSGIQSNSAATAVALASLVPDSVSNTDNQGACSTGWQRRLKESILYRAHHKCLQTGLLASVTHTTVLGPKWKSFIPFSSSR